MFSPTDFASTSNEPRLAAWDTEAQNPYSCNADPQWGPTFLAKYVSKSTKIGGCPGEPDINTTGASNLTNRTSYWYSMSLVYKPEEVQFPGTYIGPLTPQTPQKIRPVRARIIRVRSSSMCSPNDMRVSAKISSGYWWSCLLFWAGMGITPAVVRCLAPNHRRRCPTGWQEREGGRSEISYRAVKRLPES